MCLVGVANQVSSHFPFIFCGNRDEFEHRGQHVSPLNINDDGILCCIDQGSKGTWVGVHLQSGRFATVTNCRPHIEKRGLKSRGQLIMSALLKPAEEFRKDVLHDAIVNRKLMGGFNLLYGNLHELSHSFHYATNRPFNDKIRAELWNSSSWWDGFDDSGKDSSPESSGRPLKSQSVHVMGNELLGDESIKTRYLKNEIVSEIHRIDERQVISPEECKEAADELADRLASIALGCTNTPYSSGEFLRTFLKDFTEPDRFMNSTKHKKVSSLTILWFAHFLLGCCSVFGICDCDHHNLSTREVANGLAWFGSSSSVSYSSLHNDVLARLCPSNSSIYKAIVNLADSVSNSDPYGSI
jgi:hypothetical protein